MPSIAIVAVIAIGAAAMLAADLELADYQAELACWAIVVLLVVVLSFRSHRKVQ